MKTLTISSICIAILLTISGTVSHAKSGNCGEQYATLFRIAAENTWFAKNEVQNRKSLAISYDEANNGPGAGRFAKLAFLENLDKASSYEFIGLTREQLKIKEILVNSPECFPGLTETDALNSLGLLSK